MKLHISMNNKEKTAETERSIREGFAAAEQCGIY
jgi:hypothetical protein